MKPAEVISKKKRKLLVKQKKAREKLSVRGSVLGQASQIVTLVLSCHEQKIRPSWFFVAQLKETQLSQTALGAMESSRFHCWPAAALDPRSDRECLAARWDKS